MSNGTASILFLAGAVMASGWARNAHNLASASYTLLAICMLAAALIYAAYGVMDVVDFLHQMQSRNRKVHRKPQNTVKPRNNRKAG